MANSQTQKSKAGSLKTRQLFIIFDSNIKVTMIKKLFLAFSFLAVSMVFAQKNNDQQSVAEASEKLRLAMISGDKTVLESLILPELTYGHSGGHIVMLKSL